MKKFSKIIWAMLALCSSVQAQQLAFPGAQGWGRFAEGGRKGTVYHVTNLNDSGSGSLRDAVSQPNRIVVFDVAGVIHIQSRIVFSANLYVAGQTAPGEGITVYGDGISLSGASNTIVRYMRFRMGHNGTHGKDAVGIANGYNIMFDHCSVAWGTDETFSINPDNKGVRPRNITISNSIIGQGLMTHSAGGLMQSDSITIYRNLLCDNSTRNFKVKGRNQYTNNIVYNWQNAAYNMGGGSEGESFCNIESNLFINGPAKGGAAFTGGNENFHFYGDDNWQDADMDGTLSPQLVTAYSGADRQSAPYDYPLLEKWAGNTLADNLLPVVGASLPYRDYADCYMLDEVRSFGTQGALISNEESLIYGAPDTWKVWTGTARTDTDGDGMPDEWESANGTNPQQDDAMQISANGYANIENYINSISVEQRQYFLRPPMCVELSSATTTTLTLSWRDYTFEEDGFVVELKQPDGQFAEVARTAAGVTTLQLTGLEPATFYTLRLRAFAGTDKTSDYTEELRFSTRPVEVGVIDIDTYQPDYTWTSGAFSIADNAKVLLSPLTDGVLSLDATVSPASVVYNSAANLTLDGTGGIGGSASLNKAGTGTLAVNTKNTYTGATVLHDGVLEFSTLANGGEPSALGASVEYAQNWVFNGGTYRYTGPNTSTNRSAKLLSQSILDIAGNATVTMSGAFEGTGDFVLDGSGLLNVADKKFFTYTGKTVLRGSTLNLTTTDISKSDLGSSAGLVMAGGHLKTAGESNGYETYKFPISVEEGTVSQFSPNRNCYMNNTLTGRGTLQLNIPYLREYVNWNVSGFYGRVIANGLSSEKEGSLFLFQKGVDDFSNVVVETHGNARICSWDTNANVTLGGLSGTSGTYLSGSSKNTKNFNCTWTVGRANTDETFNGTINNWACQGSGYIGTVSIAKVGTGDWRLTGANDYKGTTAVRGGRLIVNGQHSGTGIVTVTSNATLAGRGTLAGKVTVYNGGTVHAGDTLINAHTLTLGGGLAVQQGGAVEIPLFASGSTSKCNKLKVTGAFTVNDGVLRLDLTDAPVIPDDKVFIVFDLKDATVSGTGFTAIEPAAPSDTQRWDTSDLLTKGYLYVRAADPDAIRGVTPEKAASPSYDLNGRRAPSSARGLHIQDGRKVIVR